MALVTAGGVLREWLFLTTPSVDQGMKPWSDRIYGKGIALSIFHVKLLPVKSVGVFVWVCGIENREVVRVCTVT